jgi:hypothetical protein
MLLGRHAPRRSVRYFSAHFNAHTAQIPIFPDDRSFERGSTIAERNGLQATASRFRTGVAAVTLENRHGSCVCLPFQGQQIWRMNMHGRDLTMKSMFDEPRPVDPNKVSLTVQ